MSDPVVAPSPAPGPPTKPAPGGPVDPSAKGPRRVRGPLLGLLGSLLLTATLIATLLWATC